MALKFSSGAVNAVANKFSWYEALANGRLLVYSGTQPTTADDDPNSTKLIEFTLGGGAYTAPAGSKAMVSLSGSSGTIDSITVGGFIELLNSAVSVTPDAAGATALADAINGTFNVIGVTATASGADVTLTGPDFLGASLNGASLTVGATTVTSTVNGGSSSTFGGTGSPGAGTDAVNGLTMVFDHDSNVLAKGSGSWQGTAITGGTAGWFRYVGGSSSEDGASTEAIRFDGSIATSGADINLASTSITASSIQTINLFEFTVPKV